MATTTRKGSREGSRGTLRRMVEWAGSLGSSAPVIWDAGRWQPNGHGSDAGLRLRKSELNEQVEGPTKRGRTLCWTG